MSELTGIRAMVKTDRGEAIAVRTLCGADMAGLMGFNANLSEVSRSRFLPHAYDEKTLEAYVKRAEQGTDRAYVALAGSAVIGYFFLWNMTEPIPTLGIGVADAYQGQGLGRRFMQILIDDAKAAGRTGIELTTVLDNEAAYQLYLKMGFQYVGDTDNVAGDGRVVRERVMFLPLKPGAKAESRIFKPPV